MERRLRLIIDANNKMFDYIKEQIISAGFDKCTAFYPGFITLNTRDGSVLLHLHDDQYEWWCEKTDGEEERVTEEFIEEQGWTLDQILALDWIYTVHADIHKYTTGKSPFQTIEEFVAFQKENSPRIFPASLTKRAVSTADDASKDQ